MEDRVTVESLIEKSIGTMGRYHIWIIFIAFLCKFPIAWHQMSIIFVAASPEFTCSDLSKKSCAEDCPNHVFNRSVFTETLVSKWDLVCDRAILKELIQSCVMFGILIGSLLFGYLGDRFGRKYPLVLGVLVECVASLCSAFTPWLPTIYVTEFLTTVGTGGTMVQSFVLLMELVGSQFRAPIASWYHLPFALGHLSLPLISYFIRDYKYFQLTISLVPLILLSYICLLPESPRWLIVTGRTEAGIKTMELIARRNKLPTEHIREDVNAFVSQNTDSVQMQKHYHFLHLFKTPVLRKYTFCIAYSWLAVGMCFYGNAQFLGQTANNIFVNVAITASAGIPGVLFAVWATKFVGRKRTLIFSNILTAVANFAISPMESDLIKIRSVPWAQILVGFIAIFGLTVWFIAVYIYSGEIFPTVIRNIGVGTTSMSARIGSIAAPFMVHLSRKGKWVPPFLFGLFAVIAAITAFWLPETKFRRMPDTIEEAEAQG